MNPAIATCKFEENAKIMTFENCNLFKRSYATDGIGFTFNNEMENKLIKEDYRNTNFFMNEKKEPRLMKSTSMENGLTVVIENNAEEIAAERSQHKKYKSKYILVSLHNPKEPADTKYIPITNTRIPLGQSTTILVSTKARKITNSGKDLTESQRGCRLDDDTEKLDIFNIYTRVACMFECHMKYATSKCGCTPWNYPINMNKTV